MKKGITGILIVALSGISVAATTVVLNKKMTKRDKAAQKVHELYMVFNRWLQIRQEGKNLAEYFYKKNYKTVAIYGMKELGERLYDELTSADIAVPYVIDKNADSIFADVDVVIPDDKLKPVDVIVVTAITYFDEIEKILSKKIDCPIVSLEDILYEI